MSLYAPTFVSHKKGSFLRCVGSVLHGVFVFHPPPGGFGPQGRCGEEHAGVRRRVRDHTGATLNESFCPKARSAAPRVETFCINMNCSANLF